MKDLIDIFLESYDFGTLLKKIDVTIEIRQTQHGHERQARHGSDKEHYISDEEIKSDLNAAMPKLLSRLLYTENIQLEKKFVVEDSNTDLNIVCVFKGDFKNKKLKLVIITVIRTPDFHKSPEEYIIKI